MAEAAQTLPHPLRRLFAYMIDNMAVWCLLGLALTVTGEDKLDDFFTGNVESIHTFGISAKLDTGIIRPFLLFGRTLCGPVQDGFKTLVESQFPDSSLSVGRLCIDRVYGVPIKGTMDATVAQPDGTVETGHLDLNLDSAVLSHIDAVAVTAFVILSWLATALANRTPGKWICGLKVEGAALAKLKREVIRLSPVLWLILYQPLTELLLGEGPRQPNPVLGWFLVVIWLAPAAVLWLWLWLIPLLRDNPTIPWDRWSGCRLVYAKASQCPDTPS